MKDIYINMNNQNILNFYGSKLDIKLDSSELYDYEVGKVEGDYSTDVLNFTTEITYSTLIIDSSCLNTPINDIKPWENEINTHITQDDCDFTIRRRTEKGWTLDFVFNLSGNTWPIDKTFYYWGIKNETTPLNYLDNNLSFSFTTGNKIKWESLRYSGNCDSVSGFSYSEHYNSGITPTLCTNGISNDFNITIVFDRYKHYTDCNLENDGGWNDMIQGPHLIPFTPIVSASTSTNIMTGYTTTNSMDVILSGETPNYEYIEELNKKWNSEKERRLGILKIYLNGRPIYKIENWEEVIPSLRSSTNQIVQIWGGGTTGSGEIHVGNPTIQLKRVKYFEEPLDYVHVHHHYLVSIKTNYNINECQTDCTDQPMFYFESLLLDETGDTLLTEENNVLIF